MEIKVGTSAFEFFKNLSEFGGGLHDVAFKDDVNELWIVYRTVDRTVHAMSFGEIATTAINAPVTLNRDNPNFQANYDMYIKGGTDKVYLDSVVEAVNTPAVRSGLDSVRSLLLSMPRYKAELSPSDYETAAVNFWYKYAGLYDYQNWETFFSDIDEFKVGSYPNTEAYAAYMRFNALYSDRCVESVPFTLTIGENGILGRVFLLDPLYGIGALSPLDMLYLFRNADAVHVCARCGQVFTNSNRSSRYCPECRSLVGKQGIINENRKKNKARYLHKRIIDKLNSPANVTGVCPDDFRAESNYYWAVIQGRQPKVMPKVASPKICTEEEYIRWLEYVVYNPYKILKDRYPKE